MPEIPRGFCQCGCGQRTSIAQKTNQRRRAGEPYLFVKGHYKGKRTHPTPSSSVFVIPSPPKPMRPTPESRAAIDLYRATKKERMPRIKAREAKILAAVKKAVADADARAFELRHRGRPKSKKRLAPMFIRSNPDALVAAVPQWQGER